MARDKFMWEESDLEIEHPIGSGKFIPLSEFNRMKKEEEARRKAAETGREGMPGEGKDGEE